CPAVAFVVLLHVYVSRSCLHSFPTRRSSDLTWISSTLATESVALAAAAATLAVMERDNVCAHLHAVGTRLLHGLHRLHQTHGDVVTGVGGLAEMCFLHFVSEPLSRDVARGCAARGLL